MKNLKCKTILISLFPIALLLNYLSSLFPSFTEHVYSRNIDKYIIQILSTITNIIPFTLYELTIIISVLSLLIYLIYTITLALKHKKDCLKFFKIFIVNCLAVISVAYFLFISLWGLNYNRLPLSETLGLTNNKHNLNQLAELYNYLIENVNSTRTLVPVDNNNISTTSGDYKNVFKRAILGYDAISEQYPTLSGNYGTPKRFLFSEFFNYTGITGIYFPYTGQSGVNIKAPSMTLPFTTLHEMAHQRGYAREDEANFIAFLTAISHPDPDFKYSGYSLALSYTSNAIYNEDPELLKELNKSLSTESKNDIIYRINFWNKYEGKINDVASSINNTYLKSNGIKDGEKSYGRMVDLLLEYYFQVIKQ